MTRWQEPSCAVHGVRFDVEAGLADLRRRASRRRRTPNLDLVRTRRRWPFALLVLAGAAVVVLGVALFAVPALGAVG